MRRRTGNKQDISIFVKKKKKRNLGRVLFIFIHWLINSKSQRNPTEFGLPVHQPAKKGGTQVLADVNQLRLSYECILLPWEFVSARMMNSNFKTAKYTAD